MLGSVGLKALPGPYNGLATKIQYIRDCYRDALLGHPEVRAYAEAIAGAAPKLNQIKAMFEALKKAYFYAGDPEGFVFNKETVGVELMKAPWEMVNAIRSSGHSSGDCDDQATLNYTLLKIMGIPAVVRVVWYSGSMPGHIYLLAALNEDTWVPFDTTSPSLGYERPYLHAEDFA